VPRQSRILGSKSFVVVRRLQLRNVFFLPSNSDTVVGAASSASRSPSLGGWQPERERRSGNCRGEDLFFISRRAEFYSSVSFPVESQPTAHPALRRSVLNMREVWRGSATNRLAHWIPVSACRMHAAPRCLNGSITLPDVPSARKVRAGPGTAAVERARLAIFSVQQVRMPGCALSENPSGSFAEAKTPPPAPPGGLFH